MKWEIKHYYKQLKKIYNQNWNDLSRNKNLADDTTENILPILRKKFDFCGDLRAKSLP